MEKLCYFLLSALFYNEKKRYKIKILTSVSRMVDLTVL